MTGEIKVLTTVSVTAEVRLTDCSASKRSLSFPVLEADSRQEVRHAHKMKLNLSVFCSLMLHQKCLSRQ